jgi:hypothetical protein
VTRISDADQKWQGGSSWKPGRRSEASTIEASRTATAIIVAFVAVLIAAGCRPERPPGPPVVVAGGDIADCATEGDQATARLVADIDGTVLTLGDHAYPDASAQDFEECYDPSWGQFKERTKPSPGNHEYHTEEASAYFDYFGGPDTNRIAGSPFLGGG